MPDEKKEEKVGKRPWYMTTRFHGFVIMMVGVGMLFSPVTAPVAPTIVTAGAAWFTGGVEAALTRKAYKNPVGDKTTPTESVTK